MYHSS